MDTNTTETTTEVKPPVVRPLKSGWGLQPPPEAVIMWGARAIYSIRTQESRFFENGKRRKNPKDVTVASIDIPYDRQDGGRDELLTTPADTKAFDKWLNTKGLPAIRKLCEKEYLTGDCDDTVEFSSEGFTIKASPRSSYGYLYLVAFKTA